jgi:hypothetical protein
MAIAIIIAQGCTPQGVEVFIDQTGGEEEDHPRLQGATLFRVALTNQGYPEQTIEPDLPAKVGAAFNVDSAALAAGEDVTDLLADSLW